MAECGPERTRSVLFSTLRSQSPRFNAVPTPPPPVPSLQLPPPLDKTLFLFLITKTELWRGKTSTPFWTFLGRVLLGFMGMETETATHSSILAWRIPWTEEPGRLQFSGSRQVEF